MVSLASKNLDEATSDHDRSGAKFPSIETDCSKRDSGRKKKKGVKFPTQRPSLENTRAISRLSSRSLEELNAVWGDEKEQNAQREKLRSDLHRVAEVVGQNSLTEHDDLDASYRCTLGLDDKIGDRAEEKLQHRENAWDAVMWEQHYQWEEQRSCNYEQVAKVYSETAHTSKVQRQAQEDAKRLEEEMQELRNDPEVLKLLSQCPRVQ